MRESRKRSVGVLVAALSVSLSAVLLSSGCATPDGVASDEILANPVLRYACENPTDYIGIDRVAREEFGMPLRFELNAAPPGLTAAQAQHILDTRYTARMSSPPGAAPAAVPVDAFTVGFFWAPAAGGVGLATGTWDVRDNYVNGSAPDDIATIGVQLNECLQIGKTTVIARDYQGRQAGSNTAYIRDAGVNGSPVIGVWDQASGFVQKADNGIVTTTVEKKPGCGQTATRGQFIYEHNQDGGSVVNVSVGFGFLSVSYNGSATALQKSAGPVGVTIS